MFLILLSNCIKYLDLEIFLAWILKKYIKIIRVYRL